MLPLRPLPLTQGTELRRCGASGLSSPPSNGAAFTVAPVLPDEVQMHPAPSGPLALWYTAQKHSNRFCLGIIPASSPRGCGPGPMTTASN